jgi:hypothetical protein
MNNQAISIKEVLSKDSYIIPIYQRNYEWDKPQIARLIEDINSIKENEQYYLGTLVTFKRSDGSYELVDGQQRHTTLNLIKAVLGEKDNFNLNFQARSECKLFFKELSNGIEKISPNEKTQNLERGISIIKDVLYEIFGQDDSKRAIFKDKFLYQTFIFRTELPKDTELNHYFEIMNNRGEQLEKHEILKALLMDKLDNDLQKNAFSEVWEACAFMGDYVWRNFSKEVSKALIDTEFSSFEEIIDLLSKKSDKDSGKGTKLIDILDNNLLPEGFTQEEKEKTYNYRSVLEFSNFLLYVYHLQTGKENSFDDKKLLDVFKDYTDVKEFIVALLKYRIYFDKYIIKNDLSSSNDSKWGIRTYDATDMETKEVAFENKDKEDKIEMLQAMFYYATISNDKKEWLLTLLKNGTTEADNLYACLHCLLKQNINNISLNTEYYPFITAKTFYYFEYMLWEVYYKYVQGGNTYYPNEIKRICDKINNSKDEFNKFYFRQLSSKEHLLAQNKISTIEVDTNLPIEAQEQQKSKILNSFGNLCLISNVENSSAGKDNPEDKKKFYYNSISLKRLLMFETFSRDDNSKWNTEEINKHQEEMNTLLEFYKH